MGERSDVFWWGTASEELGADLSQQTHDPEGGASDPVIDPDPPEANPSNPVNWLAATGLGLGIAAVIGIFTALGVEGELFSRMLRNNPSLVRFAFILALLGIVLGVVSVILGRKNNGSSRVVMYLGLAALFAGACMAVWVGIASAGVREQPSLTVVRIHSDGSTTNGSDPDSSMVRINATGSFLRSDDRMFLRIGGFPASVSTQAAWDACRDTGTTAALTTLSGGDVLAASESGSSTSGTSSAEVTLEVSTTAYAHLCAVAVLSPNSTSIESNGRFATSLIDLNTLASS